VPHCVAALAQTRIPRAVLAREAIDDLLAKYHMLDGGSAEVPSEAAKPTVEPAPAEASAPDEAKPNDATEPTEELHLAEEDSLRDNLRANEAARQANAEKSEAARHRAYADQAEAARQKARESMSCSEASARADAWRERQRAKAKPKPQRPPMTPERKAQIQAKKEADQAKRAAQQAEIAKEFAKSHLKGFYHDPFGKRYEVRARFNSVYFFAKRVETGAAPFYERIPEYAFMVAYREEVLTPTQRRRRMAELHLDKMGREQTPDERDEYTFLSKT
jgi:hypothetical protein